MLPTETDACERAAVDVLRSARRRREVYPGEWLPEPLVAPADERVTLDERISYALMVALEPLTPAERVAWVLHDLFAMPFDDIARTVGRSPGAVRQLAKRARDHVQATTPRVPVDRDEHAAVVRTFMSAPGQFSMALDSPPVTGWRAWP